MKVTIEMTIEGHEKEKVICIQREAFTSETIELSLEEAKKLTSEIQEKMVEQQVEVFNRPDMIDQLL